MGKIDKFKIQSVNRHRPFETPQADTATLEKAADLLLAARRPLIITSYSGRNPETVTALVTLSETLSAKVITGDVRMSFPSTHPLCAGINSLSGASLFDEAIKTADVVLVIDHDVPYVPDKNFPDSKTKIIHLDIDPVKKDIPLWMLPVDLSIEADSAKALPSLQHIIEKKMLPEQTMRISARFEALQKAHQNSRKKDLDLAQRNAHSKPIHPDWLCRCLSDVLDDNTILLTDITSDANSVAKQIDRIKPGTLFSSNGASLGWGLGAALGAKLAAPGSMVVSLMGDGGFVFGSPIAALWAAVRHKAPFLGIIFNNQSYQTVKRILKRKCGITDLYEKEPPPIGVDIIPCPDYAMIAQATGAYGRKVENPGDLKDALSEAIEQVIRGKPAILDVMTAVSQ